MVVLQFVLMASVIAAAPLTGALSTSPWDLAGSAILILAGATYGIAGARALTGNRTPFPKPLPGSRLVQHGVYRLVRHPLYTALVHLGFGWALLWQSWPAAALTLVLALQLLLKARIEEAWLRKKFADYPAYAARVKRFIPWIW